MKPQTSWLMALICAFAVANLYSIAIAAIQFWLSRAKQNPD
jgi:hypothetical protein